MKSGFVPVTSASAPRWGRLFWPLADSKRATEKHNAGKLNYVGGAGMGPGNAIPVAT
jgi:hypothetical protein